MAASLSAVRPVVDVVGFLSPSACSMSRSPVRAFSGRRRSGCAGRLIKIEDRGPVFYSQDRVGEGGRMFRAWKFRSMIPDAEKHVGAVQASRERPASDAHRPPDARNGDGRAPSAVEHLRR